MSEKDNDTFRQLAIGVGVWLVVQLAGSIWWASAITTRLGQIEESMIQASEIAMRLARVEERMVAQNNLLCQIQTELVEMRKRSVR
jgi:hypothetical protein